MSRAVEPADQGEVISMPHVGGLNLTVSRFRVQVVESAPFRD